MQVDLPILTFFCIQNQKLSQKLDVTQINITKLK
jgi:hypothetical protein